MTRKPDLFIVGAPKSGTTSLYAYLAVHPDIYMSPVKEPLYFCPDVRSGRSGHPYAYPEEENAYLALFSEAGIAKRLGEATTRYLVSHDAARLVHEFQPDAYAVALLRNPIDMVQALHNERVSQGHETITDFAAAMAADDERARGVGLPWQTNQLGGVYRESATYAQPLQRWIDALGAERVHTIVFDDFARDTRNEFKRVLAFLGVAADFQPPAFAARNASHRQRPAVRRIVDSRPGTWLTHDVAGAVLGKNARARLALRFRQSRINRRPYERQPIPESMRSSLAAQFRPDVERLSKMLDRDLVGLWLDPANGRSG